MDNYLKFFGKTYDELFEGYWKSFTKGIEDHQFSHFNQAMGIHIYGKEHYKYEMKKRRMLPYDYTEGLASQWDKHHKQERVEDLTPKARGIIKAIENTKDENGNVRIEGRLLNALIEIGAVQPQRDVSSYAMSGGFSS